MKSKKEFQEILDRFLKGETTPQETALVEKWYASIDKHNNFPSADKEEDELFDREDLDKIKKRIRPIPKLYAWLPSMSVAASLLILALAISYTFKNQPPSKINGMSDILDRNAQVFDNKTSVVRVVMLPDSTIISLKPESSITISNHFNKEDRKVHLRGEAFFNVSHNPSKPFYVFANELGTKVLGTTFSVQAFAEQENITVEVKSGKVSVFSNTGENISAKEEKIVLTPNQKVIYSRRQNRATRKLVDDPQIILPKDEIKKLRFEDAPLHQIFDSIEKMYGVDISFDEQAFSKCFVTTSVTDGDLYERIDVICEIIGATYNVDETRIEIRGNGCK